MTKLTAKKRSALPSSSFALAGRKYPINDPSHARNALSRVSQYGTPREKATVRARVHSKYPAIGSRSQTTAKCEGGYMRMRGK